MVKKYLSRLIGMEKVFKHALYLKKDTIIYRSHYADTADQTIDETLHVTPFTNYLF